MEWMVINPLQVHGTFASVGVQVGDSYHVNKDCLTVLYEILNKLSLEHRHLRTFRRALGFTQVIQKDLLPLLINVKDDFKIIDTTIRILVNLTIPVECLLPLDVISKSDVGRHTTFELNKLLISGKEAFVDAHSTRAVVNYMKRVLEKSENLTNEECESVNNCLLLLRNILHIPEFKNNQHSSSLQNQILWNLFTQSIDKILIHLMTCVQKGYWGVTMVQLIAIMYKDQHVGTLQKLLNQWFEASLSESSEDNESNTSPPDQGSGGESSPVLTSDPTSDSSDNGCNQKDSRIQNHNNKTDMDLTSSEPDRASVLYHSKLTPFADLNKQSGKNFNENVRKNQSLSSANRKNCSGKGKRERNGEGEMSPPTQPCTSHLSNHQTSRSCKSETSNSLKCPSSSELSDYGYATQVENQESISTSSNEDECLHSKRPVHQKPHSMQKIRLNTKHNNPVPDKKELRRKKLVKRSKTNIMNMKALLHHIPSDEDISNLLKEFTVDFLLKGYGSLVQELHSQLLNCKQCVHVDTSHFFWLVTYFLKFAAQLELELEHISSVLSFEIISYLTFEGVNLCEQLELVSRNPGSDLKPYLRRMHLVVTAIREFIQAVETYRKLTHLSKEDREHLLQLQIQIASTEDLKCLFVLLLHHFNPNIQSKQYLQDLIVTNHILLIFLDSVGKLPDFKGNINIMDHIKQFASVEVMHQYGLLLEDFQNNGEFINDCIFTMMHHIGGDLEQVSALFQPNILKTFSKIWETDYEVCDDWSDLIEYVIHKFIDKPRQYSTPIHQAPVIVALKPSTVGKDTNILRWPKDELDSLYWFYVQSAKCSDAVGRVKDLYAENGITNKTRIEIIQQLLSQDIINQVQYEEFMKKEKQNNTGGNENHHKDVNPEESKTLVTTVSEKKNEECKTSNSDQNCDQVSELRDQLLKEKKGGLLTWLQKLLIEACFVKLNEDNLLSSQKGVTMEPIPHHYTLMNQSIPVVPWNSEQKNSLSCKPFVSLLHKMGFHLPADSGKLFVRIPNFWTPDVLFSIAQKLGPVNQASLKFNMNLVNTNNLTLSPDSSKNLATQANVNQFAIQPMAFSTPVIRSSPLPNSSHNWLQLVMHSKISTSPLPPRPVTPPKDSVPAEISIERDTDIIGNERGSDCSVCETIEGSVTSDLTRMCVSDEEERTEHQVFSDSTIT